MIVTHGVWRIYPLDGIAFNCHNGNPARINFTASGVSVTSVNVPAKWMLEQLAKWAVASIFGPTNKEQA